MAAVNEELKGDVSALSPLRGGEWCGQRLLARDDCDGSHRTVIGGPTRHLVFATGLGRRQ